MRSRLAAGAAPGWLERNGAICTRAPSHPVFERTELDFGFGLVPAPLDGAYVELSSLRGSFQSSHLSYPRSLEIVLHELVGRTVWLSLYQT